VGDVAEAYKHRWQIPAVPSAHQLLPLVYDKRRKLAAARVAEEKPEQTLQAAALVHESYLRLVSVGKTDQASITRCRSPAFDSRGHFIAAAVQGIQRILVESARRRPAASAWKAN
jgi:hypothetical protein